MNKVKPSVTKNMLKKLVSYQVKKEEGEGLSQGTYIKDPWTKTKQGRTEYGRWWVDRAGESNGGKMGTIVIEQQYKNFFLKKGNQKFYQNISFFRKSCFT